MTADASALAGRVLNGTYRIVRPLARGGMGAIYTAEHARLAGKRYAIKMLHPVFVSDDEVFQRFRREAEIASQLGHEHIVDVHDFNVTPEGEPYMVMEFLQGEDLGARISRGALPLGDVVRIVTQVASALAAAHAAGVVHRDLKPQNIFLIDRTGTPDFVKVLDFGISKVRDSSSLITADQAVMGTPFYMSPEQAMGRARDVDPRTDVFALGAIVWEMLTGAIAFASDTIPGALYKVVHEQPRPVHEVRRELPPALTDVLARAMAKERDARTPSVHAFAAELAQAVAQPAIPARPGGIAPSRTVAPAGAVTTTMSRSNGQVVVATAPRSRASRIIGLTLGVLLVAGVAVGLATRGETQTEEPVQPAARPTIAPRTPPTPAPPPAPPPAPAPPAPAATVAPEVAVEPAPRSRSRATRRHRETRAREKRAPEKRASTAPPAPARPPPPPLPLPLPPPPPVVAPAPPQPATLPRPTPAPPPPARKTGGTIFDQ